VIVLSDAMEILDEHGSIVDALNADDDFLREAVAIPDEEGDKAAREHREDMFSPFWENNEVDKEVIIESVKEHEERMLDEFGEEVIPDWVLRIEAQQVIAAKVLSEINE
jgi:hypothetical protein